MRQIGTLPRSTDPNVFRDHLLSVGVDSRVVESKDGWDLWVYNEDHLPRAREELAGYEKAPDDPRFHASAARAEGVRKEADRLDRQYLKNVRGLKDTWGRADLRRRPLTAALIAVCAGVFLAGVASQGWDDVINDRLGFTPPEDLGETTDLAKGLAAIHRGEVWRLVTPIFLHYSWAHVLFNLWAVAVEGTVIEGKRGTPTFAALVFLSAVASNIGEYVYEVNFFEHTNPFGGISGVAYALFGYLWVRGRLQPWDGVALSPGTVRVMLLWLLFGFTGILPMANGAHVVGLVVGMMFAAAGF